MPARTLQQMLDQQEEMIHDLSQYRTEVRVLKWIVGLLLLILVFLGGLAAYAQDASRDAKDAARTAQTALANQEQARIERLHTDCENTNARRAEQREAFLSTLLFIDPDRSHPSWTILDLDGPGPQPSYPGWEAYYLAKFPELDCNAPDTQS